MKTTNEKEPGAAHENRKLRYYRIQQMYTELRTYRLDTNFIMSTLATFFTVTEVTIMMAIKEDPITDVHYEHLDLDKGWVAGLVKKVTSDKYRLKAKKQELLSTQSKLF